MNDFQEFEGDNIGGINNFYFIPKNSVLSIPTRINGIIPTAIILKQNTRWFKGYSTYETLGFSEPEELTAHGAKYKPKIVGIVPKISIEMDVLFNEMRNQKFILIITDNNGLKKIIGSIDEPLLFNFKKETGSSLANRNNYSFEFSGETKLPSCVYLY